jgi:hypothetical protein
VNISQSVSFREVVNIGKIENERVSVSFGEVFSEECFPKCLVEGKSECVS